MNFREEREEATLFGERIAHLSIYSAAIFFTFLFFASQFFFIERFFCSGCVRKIAPRILDGASLRL